MSYRVLAFGELLWDLLPTGKVIGGAPANFAYRLNQLGIQTGLITRVGSDALGSELLSILRSREIPTELIQIDSLLPTGTVDVTLSPSGDASYTIIPNVAYDAITLTEQMIGAAKVAEVICYGSLVQRGKTTRETLYGMLESAPQAVKIVDINLRKECFSRETVDSSLKYADILKLNDQEVLDVAGLIGLPKESPSAFAKEAISKYELRAVVITRGADGVEGYDSLGAAVQLPGIKVAVQDTVGSGDNFTAGFLYQYLRGESLESCITLANKIGALTATKSGGMPAFTADELKNLLA